MLMKLRKNMRDRHELKKPPRNNSDRRSANSALPVKHAKTATVPRNAVETKLRETIRSAGKQEDGSVQTYV